MKYSSLFLLLFALTVVGTVVQAQTATEENTEISLHVTGLPSAWVRLQGVQGNVKSKLDSVQLDAQGNALFKYGVRLDPGCYELLLPNDVVLPILLDEDQTVALSTQATCPIECMQVRGSFENTLLYNTLQYDTNLGVRFQAQVEELQAMGQQLDQAQIDQLRQQYFFEQKNYYTSIFSEYPNSLFTKYEKAKQAPAILNDIVADPTLDVAARQEGMLSHFWDNVDFSDERLLHTTVAFDKLWEYMNRYVPNQTDIKLQAVDILMEKVLDHPAYYKFFAKWLADDYMPPFNGQMDPDAFYIHMVDNYLTTERAFWTDSLHLYAYQLRAEDMRNSLVGMKGESFQACDPAGREYALDDIKAPYIALFFYHSDCEHCIKETPVMVQRYREMKDQGLEVVAVAMSTPEDEWNAFIEKNEMDWINVTDADNNSIYKKYFVRATPEIYLLNPDRTIIGKHLSPDDVTLVMQMDRMQRLKNKEVLAGEQ